MSSVVPRETVLHFINLHEPSYGPLLQYAALPLILTPELLHFLRHTFTPSTPWVAEADILLDENLCLQYSTYEQYLMHSSLRAYLLDDAKQNPRFRLADASRLLLGYLEDWERTRPYLNPRELQTQAWSAMVYIDDNHRLSVFEEIKESFRKAGKQESGSHADFVDETQLVHLTNITEKLAPEMSKYPELLDYARQLRALIRGDLTLNEQAFRPILGEEMPTVAELIGRKRIRLVSDAHKDNTGATEWLSDLLEIQKEVYVLTPKGKIIKLPRGATIVDFAYAVHTDIGNACVSARIDKTLSPLQKQLENGQTVEVITAPWVRPNPAWLNFVVTAKARSAIRGYLRSFKKNEAISLGQKLLERELNARGMRLENIPDARFNELLKILDLSSRESLYEDIGLGNRLPFLMVRLLMQEEIVHTHRQEGGDKAVRNPLIIKGSEGMVVSLAKCCRPIPRDEIAAFFNPGKGIVVHSSECKNVIDLRKKQFIGLDVEWDRQVIGDFPVEIRLELLNKLGTLAKLASVISKMKATIENVQITHQDSEVSIDVITLAVKDRTHLAQIMRELRKLSVVLKISRVRTTLRIKSDFEQSEPKQLVPKTIDQTSSAPSLPTTQTEQNEQESSESGGRVQKVLAQAGLGSRREIEGWIRDGRVTVNDKRAELGDRCLLIDRVEVDGKRIELTELFEESNRVLLYYKPTGEVVSRHDPEGRKAVFDNLPKLSRARWVTVGRMDINTQGLLLVTTSGELADRLMRASREIERKYAVRVMGLIDDTILERLAKGVILDDGPAQFETIMPVGGKGANRWFHVTLKENRKQIVRRIFESQGVTVNRLILIKFADLELPQEMKPRTYIELSPEQVAGLMERVGLRPYFL